MNKFNVLDVVRYYELAKKANKNNKSLSTDEAKEWRKLQDLIGNTDITQYMIDHYKETTERLISKGRYPIGMI